MDRLEQLQKLAAMSPDDPLAHYAVGLELIQREQWPDAVGAFDRALAADGQYSAAYYHKARAQIRGGEHGAAKETLASGIRVAGEAGDWKTRSEMEQLLETIA